MGNFPIDRKGKQAFLIKGGHCKREIERCRRVGVERSLFCCFPRVKLFWSRRQARGSKHLDILGVNPSAQGLHFLS